MNLCNWRKVQSTDIFINVQKSATCQHFAPQISLSHYILLLVFYRRIAFLSRSKRNGFETSSFIFIFLFQKIKEEIISHPQVEIMRWLINWWLSTFFCLEKSGKFLKYRIQISLRVSQTVTYIQNMREVFGY